jgi:hypothetical protein
MSWPAVVAIYAAVLATASFAWQVLSWWLRERTKVRVEVYLDWETEPDGRPDGPDEVRIKVVNDGAVAVDVVGHVLEAKGGQGERFRINSTSATRVEPRSRHLMRLALDDVSAIIDTDQPIRASVTLGNDSIVRSDWVALRD